MEFDALSAALIRAADPTRAASMHAYMKRRFDFLGIPRASLRTLCKPLFRAAADSAPDWNFVNRCWAAPQRELQYAALDYLQALQMTLVPADVTRLQSLIVEKSWWDTADCLDRIVGGMALRYPEVNPILLDWSVSDNLWLRRVAIDHQLLRKERTDTVLLTQILCNNLGRKEFFINKAIGWALRDYSKTDPEWVCRFIKAHGDKMARLSLREAEKYL